jgi:hypothetical protein
MRLLLKKTFQRKERKDAKGAKGFMVVDSGWRGFAQHIALQAN